ncbi:hypothetical protein CR513_56389, partial [Mucuna pruriens]
MNRFRILNKDHRARVVHYKMFSNSSEPFIVYSDASKMSLSDVVMLKNLVMTWAPRQLKAP